VENPTNKEGVGSPTTNPKKTNTKPRQLIPKLGMKVRGGNASEEAGLKIRDTDVKNRGHQLRWFGVGTEPKGSKHNNNREE
jgi:hypothetical protein